MPEVTLVIVANVMCKEGNFRPEFPQREFNAGGGRRERGHLRVDDKRARELIESGFARLAKPAGPAETKPAGPAETKEIAVEKKSSGAPTTGLLTDLPSSSAPGKAEPSSALPADPALPPSSSSVRGTRRTRRAARSE